MERLQGAPSQTLFLLAQLLPLRESQEEHTLSGNHQELKHSWLAHGSKVGHDVPELKDSLGM